MKELVQDALSIIDSFDWNWSMCDSNYKAEKRRAENLKNNFLLILIHIKDEDIVNALRDVWTAHYELALPYMKSDYYDSKKQALKNAKERLNQLTEVSITI